MTATDDLLSAIGPSAYRRLVEVHGGTRVAIPARKAGRRWQALVQVIGEHAARAAVESLGGEQLPIQNFGAVPSVEGRVAVGLQRGMTVVEIARMVGCTEKTVYKHARRFKGRHARVPRTDE